MDTWCVLWSIYEETDTPYGGGGLLEWKGMFTYCSQLSGDADAGKRVFSLILEPADFGSICHSWRTG